MSVASLPTATGRSGDPLVIQISFFSDAGVTPKNLTTIGSGWLAELRPTAGPGVTLPSMTFSIDSSATASGVLTLSLTSDKTQPPFLQPDTSYSYDLKTTDTDITVLTHTYVPSSSYTRDGSVASPSVSTPPFTGAVNLGTATGTLVQASIFTGDDGATATLAEIQAAINAYSPPLSRSSIPSVIANNSDGTVHTITESDTGAVVTYGYSGGNVVSETRVAGGLTAVRNFTYNSDGSIATIVDPSGGGSGSGGGGGTGILPSTSALRSVLDSVYFIKSSNLSDLGNIDHAIENLKLGGPRPSGVAGLKSILDYFDSGFLRSSFGPIAQQCLADGVTDLMLPPFNTPYQLAQATSSFLTGVGGHLGGVGGLRLHGYAGYQADTVIQLAAGARPTANSIMQFKVNGTGTVTMQVSGHTGNTGAINYNDSATANTALSALTGKTVKTAASTSGGITSWTVFLDQQEAGTLSVTAAGGSAVTAAAAAPPVVNYAMLISEDTTTTPRVLHEYLTLDGNGPNQPGGAWYNGSRGKGYPIWQHMLTRSMIGGGNVPATGETYALGAYHAAGFLFDDVDCDNTGGALGITCNASTNATSATAVARDCSSYDSDFSHGFSWYECGPVKVINCDSSNNGVGTAGSGGSGFNCEESTATTGNEYYRASGDGNSISHTRYNSSETTTSIGGTVVTTSTNHKLRGCTGAGSPNAIQIAGNQTTAIDVDRASAAGITYTGSGFYTVQGGGTAPANPTT